MRHEAKPARYQAPARSGTSRTLTAAIIAAALVPALAWAQIANDGTDYYGKANWANSPAPAATAGTCSVTTTQSCYASSDCPATETCVGSAAIKKFVDTLPGLCGISPWGTSGANGLGQCIPVATAVNGVYEIGLQEYSQKLHSDLPATKLRGYIDLTQGGKPQYLGPMILATRDVPVKVHFRNQLPTGHPGGDLFIPTDTTYMGAGDGPNCADGTPATPTSTCAREQYTQNRATLHLHGGNTPWISDGTPHQWTAPAGESTNYKKGVSARDVPGMNATGDGEQTYYWTNEQTGRLMFYHDHAYGITRLNVYAGEAAGYLLVDPQAEAGLLAATVPGTIPDPANLGTADLAHVVPLVIQDKTFVSDQTPVTDPTWNTTKYGGPGSLWFPHVYMPNQDPVDQSGANPFGRWDYGPWFWPPQNPASLVSPPYTCGAKQCPGTPNPSGTPEGFMDTPVVNGTAYPSLPVEAAAYRFQILAAGNDRAWNLGIYYAADKNGNICKFDPNATTQAFDAATCTEVSMVPAVPPTASSTLQPCAINPTQSGAQLAMAAEDASGEVLNGTGLATGCWPSTWPTDARDGGVPDPTTAGPAIVQIGTEGGLLPKPVAIPSTPVGFEYNRRSITVLNIFTHGLLIGPAERADVVVDFSSVPAGSTLILYNDSPAPAPAFDSRFDYYTNDPDQTATGGAPTTLPGYGPNTRTVMQFVVGSPSSTTTQPKFSFAALKAAQPALFVATQDPIIIPETAYGAPSDNYVRIQDTSMSFFSGALSGITLTSGGAGYTAAPTVTISGGGATTDATAVAVLAPRSVASLTVTNGGSYTTKPTVTISGGGGTGATATATLAAQGVASVTVTKPGSKYTSVPTVSFSGGGGGGAAATATVSGGKVTAITVTAPGTGYTSAPTVTLSGGGGSGATATAALQAVPVTALTVTNAGSGYTSAPSVSFSGTGGAAATATLTTAPVVSVTLTSGGAGYTSAPTVTIAAPQTTTGTPATAVAVGTVYPLQAKAIQELFTLDYGRMNATLGVELPFTNFTTQTTIPYGYVDPPTEIFKDNETQLWKITHNGVDTHFIHFHLFTVQVVNRVGWDGAIKPPDANEVGFKDTVRMNPLEDIIVALRPMQQKHLPFKLPNSVRPLDVTQPIGSTSAMAYTNVDPTNQPAAVVNQMTNFGQEYVWHCHLLGHEENDMMRAMAFVVAPGDPTGLRATAGSSGSGSKTKVWVDLAWTAPNAGTDASGNPIVNWTGYTVQRATNAAGPWTTIGSVAAATTSYRDATAARKTTYYYQVIANNLVGYTQPYAAPAAGYPSAQADSAPVVSAAVTTL